MGGRADIRMALSRLALAERKLLLQKQGFRRCFSSSPGRSTKTSPSKRVGAAKEKKTSAVESFVKKYMLINPGVFPKTKQVQNEVGGSWYLLKDILMELKEKIKDDPQVYKQITSAKADVIVETASEATVTEDNADIAKVNDPDSEVQPLDLQAHKNIATGEISHVTEEKASEAIVIEEGTHNEKLVKPDDRRVNSHVSPVLEHGRDKKPGSQNFDQKPASEKLSCMIGRTLSEEEEEEEEEKEEATKASGNGLDSNDVKSSDWTFVENGHQPSDIKVRQIFTTKKIPSSGQMPTGLVDLFKTRFADARADEKNSMTNETLKGDSFSVSKTASADEFGRRQELTSFISRLKELVKVPKSHDIPDTSNKHIRDLRNRNGMGTMHKTVKFLNPNGEERTLCEHGISDDIKKPAREEKQVEPLDMVVKDANDREPKSVDHTIICDETDQLDKNEEPTKIPFEMFESQLESENGSGSDSDFAAADYTIDSVTQPLLPRIGLKPHAFLHTEKGNNWSSLLVKFLRKSATVNDIGVAFGDCGPIAKIRVVPSRKENMFNYAYINFKTEKGLRKAQTKTDMVIGGGDVVVEATSPLPGNPIGMHTPGPFGAPDVPMPLLKNLTRTVMIKGLPGDLTSHHLSHVLSFYGHISGFAMGSSSSIAYVEFETEDAKEKALAVPSIPISGRTLSVLRIDAPLTTVVRIFNIGSASQEGKIIHNICNSHGRVKRVVHRDSKIVDVHFMLTEWANMVNILNSLNGLVINQQQWIAKPATVIPVEILHTLLSKPDGWRHVHSSIQNLCRKIKRDSFDISELTDLVAEYHGEKAES